MRSKIIKTLVISFFAGVIAFTGITFLASDLDAIIVYHKKHEKYNSAGEYIGIECYDKGSDCKIKVVGGLAVLLPAN